MSSEKVEEVPKKEANSEETQETLSEMAKLATLVYKRKKVATSSLSVEKPSSPSQKDEEVGSKEIIDEEAPARKRGKGKDITIIASAQKVQNIDKMASRPLSRVKYFDFESLKTKGWNLSEFTDPQGWSGFVSTQEQIFENLVKEFYASLRVKQKNEEKFLVSTVKGVKIQVTQDYLKYSEYSKWRYSTL